MREKDTCIMLFTMCKALSHWFSYMIPIVRRAKIINNPTLQIKKSKPREAKKLIGSDTDLTGKFRHCDLTIKLYEHAHACTPPPTLLYTHVQSLSTQW